MRKSEQMVKSVYEIKCWWGDDCDDRTTRYVVASSEDETDQKMKKWLKNQFIDLLNKENKIMQSTFLRDERGGILATLHIQDNGDIIIYDKNLHYKGRYLAKANFTLNENGSYVGKGNLTATLITK